MNEKDKLFETVPIRLYDHETDPDTGKIIILRPKFTSDFAQKIIIPFLKSNFFKIKLDEIGSAVWQNIDSSKTVGEIYKILENELGNKQEQLDKRLRQFITQLSRQKFIELRIVRE